MSVEPLINAKRVNELFMYCMADTQEELEVSNVVSGIRVTVGIHRERIAEVAAEVTEMLLNLPTSFMTSGGGGMTFLNACDDKNGTQWTGEHKIMDELFMLGEGLGIVSKPMPSDFWSVLPGGVPYYVVNDTPDVTTDELKVSNT